MKIFPFIKIMKNYFTVDDKNFMVKKVTPSIETELEYAGAVSHEKGGHQKNGGHGDDKAKEHFLELKRTADLVNSDLIAKGLPFRFRIYEDLGEIFIDLVRLNSDNQIVEVKKKNITHEEFREIIRHIELKEGLFFESMG